MGKTVRKYRGKEYKDRDSRDRKSDRSCLNHGSCSWCKENRVHKFKTQYFIPKEILEEIEDAI